jgi:hypothetical protein
VSSLDLRGARRRLLRRLRPESERVLGTADEFFSKPVSRNPEAERFYAAISVISLTPDVVDEREGAQLLIDMEKQAEDLSMDESQRLTYAETIAARISGSRRS